MLSIFVGESVYYEENSGVLLSEKPYARIRVPQDVLDIEKEYVICFRETVNRSAYNKGGVTDIERDCYKA